jgi:hypothetical protein
MASSGMLRRVTLVITDVSEEFSASFMRVTRIGELGKLAVTSNRRTLRRAAVIDYEKECNMKPKTIMNFCSYIQNSTATQIVECVSVF